MHRIFIIFSVLFSSLCTTAQDINSDSVYVEQLVASGNELINLEQYDSAVAVFQAAIIILEEEELWDKLADVYLKLSECYFELNDCGLDKLHIGRALDLKKKIYGSESPEVAEVLHDFALSMSDCGDYESAMELLNQALAIFQNSGKEYETHAASAMVNIGWQFGRARDYTSAFEYLLPAYQIRKRLNGYWTTGLANTAHIIGYYSIYAGQFEQAEEYVRIGLEIRQKLRGPNHHETVQSWQKLGECQLYQRKYKESLPFFQKALAALAADPEIEFDLSRNPIIDGITSLYVFRQLLNMKTHSLRSHHAADPTDSVALVNALNTNRLSLRVSKELLARSSTRETQLSVLDGEKPLVLNSLLIDHSLYKRTGSREYLDHAFHMMEHGRNQILRLSIHGDQAWAFANIPNELKNEEERLAREISTAQLQLTKATTDSTTEKARSDLIHSRQEYDQLISNIESDYPVYHRIKYEDQTITIDSVQAQMDADELLVSYYGDYYNLIAISITSDSTWMNAVRVPGKFNRDVQKLINWVSNQPTLETNHDSLSRAFGQTSNKVFNELITKAIGVDSNYNLPRKLTIIPEGHLSYLPFELLVTQLDSNQSSYLDLNYLIKESNIRYAYSADEDFNRRYNNSISKESLISFAPEYDSSDFSFPELTMAKEEAIMVGELMEGRSLTGATASKGQFISVASKAGILHLAMHTVIDDRDPMKSRFVFTSNDDLDEQLLAYELFGMNLSARLAVLSGCETGLGRLSKGEGVLSLSRAFAYAGCPSIVMSLWKANDLSNHSIMKSFYSDLKNGIETSEALRKAKLNYLDHADALSAHPFYWAPFVLIGESNNFTQTSMNVPWSWIGVGILLALLLFAGFKLRQS